MARWVANIVLDRWWYDSVTTAEVWRTRFVAQLVLLVGVGLVTLSVLGTSVWFVLRTGRLQGEPTSRALKRYHERMGPAHRWLLIVIVVYFTIHIGVTATRYWQSWLLFRHGGNLGVDVPVAGGDLGYYLFRLPFLSSSAMYLRQLMLFTIGVSIFGHAMSGALRRPRGPEPSSRLAIAHLAMLAAAFLAVQAVYDIFVARPSIATNRIGAFDGPGFTELNITKPGLVVAALATLAAGFAAVWWAKSNRWRPFAITLSIALGVQLIVVVIAPALSERLLVAPAEAQRQLWSIDENLQATRAAYEIDDITTEPLGVDDSSVAGGPIDDQLLDDVDRVQLFDIPMMTAALQVLSGRTGTRITDVDVDRFDLDGAVEPVFVAARSASRNDVPEQGWVQDHLVYTHGIGVVTVPANRVDADGRPDVTAYPDAFGAAETPLYFGESLDNWYALVGTRREQLGNTEFAGVGIDMSSRLQQLVLALAVGESQPVLTNELTDETQLLYRRSVRERVGSLAPFLQLDGDPYPVVTDGRVTWVIDGYTTSSTFPYSQFTNGSGLPASSGLAGRNINYLRGSVKATVDAETGETHLYRTDDGGDPILQTWSEVFPDLLEPADAIPQEIQAHLRYPADQWNVQTGLLGRYHVDSAEELFNGTNRWAVSAGAATTVGDTTIAPAPPVDLFSEFAGGPDRFGSIRPYGPGSATNPTSTRDELAALALADHDLDRSVHLLVPDTAGSAPLLSPQVAQSAIDADPELARAITLLNANGSKVQFGPMTPIVVDEGLVWVRPIVVTGTGTSAAPRLYGVAAVYNGLVAVQPTSRQAVIDVLGAAQR